MVLPKGLEFLHFGWWVIHVLAILFVYTLAYRRGRNDEKREQRNDQWLRYVAAGDRGTLIRTKDVVR